MLKVSLFFLSLFIIAEFVVMNYISDVLLMFLMHFVVTVLFMVLSVIAIFITTEIELCKDMKDMGMEKDYKMYNAIERIRKIRNWPKGTIPYYINKGE